MPSSVQSAVSQGLSPQQVADILGCHCATVRRIIDRGELPTYRVGHLVRVREADVVAYQQRGRRAVLTDAQRATIEAAVATWPPLTPEQRDVIRTVFATPPEGVQ